MNRQVATELEQILDILLKAHNGYTAAVFLLDQTGSKLNIKASKSRSDKLIKNISINVGEGLVGFAAKHQKEVKIEQLNARSRNALKYYQGDVDVDFFLAYPITIKGRQVGLLTFDKIRGSKSHVDLHLDLASYAKLISSVIILMASEDANSDNSDTFKIVSSIIDRLTVTTSFKDLVRRVKVIMRELVSYDQLIIAEKDDNLCYLLNENGEIFGDSVELQNCRIGYVLSQNIAINSPLTGQIKIAPTIKPLKYSSLIAVPIAFGDDAKWAIGLLSRTKEPFPKAIEIGLKIIGAALSGSFYHYRTKVTPKISSIDISSRLERDQFFLEQRKILFIVSLLGFRHVNLEIGFKGGDKVLNQALKRLEDVNFSNAKVIRYYADRFLILSNVADKADGYRMMQDSLQAIEQKPFLSEGVEVIIRGAIGGALYPENGVNIEQLIDKGEFALKESRLLKSEKILIYNDNNNYLTSLKSV
ncbi:MAG: diguanylate cyclase domain-containing protein [Nitrospinota bacterium]